jgi:hypothetical protein
MSGYGDVLMKQMATMFERERALRQAERAARLDMPPEYRMGRPTCARPAPLAALRRRLPGRRQTTRTTDTALAPAEQ